ncbi:acetyl-CoA carboxylase biotin carboxyl carrier protein subunit [Jeotgalibacillus sp. R-1-5s-1]|uniref:acetyl-CoA carboxylase biotin carboxyl carrier protein subunit n=1 Tax=Jeotgalibacillus sp. R-1-5s-1 TaxID=2555897 RepID=UPI00106C415D|nr:acetyl-CoA carboxylase biotin carboxyl carrier protein subunit [Jeotgalibacillus sp. R-1-5s-1]TFE03586.1 acetyl-CoA carboxylase biotin carboxyl carrier protein subunit [Jeotgalibacillus sp. R-1-5s-1]
MKNIQSTMAGTVLQVLVKAGDQVEAGQAVMMLESMKMEIPVEAETSGTVNVIKVNAGDFVNEGDDLLTLE